MFDFSDAGSSTVPHKLRNVGVTVFRWAQYLYRIAVFKVRSKLSAQVVRNAHHPQLVLFNFSKLKILYCVLHIYMCVCSMCIYTHTHYMHMYVNVSVRYE